MPFCHLALKAKKPTSAHYPTEIRTLGDHLRKRRLDIKLIQREAGKRIGVDTCTIFNWEWNRCSPRIHHLPQIIEFLGYCPYDPAWSPGRVLTVARKYRGLRQKDLARRLGVDPGTLGRWERGERRPGLIMPEDQIGGKAPSR